MNIGEKKKMKKATIQKQLSPKENTCANCDRKTGCCLWGWDDDDPNKNIICTDEIAHRCKAYTMR